MCDDILHVYDLASVGLGGYNNINNTNNNDNFNCNNNNSNSTFDSLHTDNIYAYGFPLASDAKTIEYAEAFLPWGVATFLAFLELRGY